MTMKSLKTMFIHGLLVLGLLSGSLPWANAAYEPEPFKRPPLMPISFLYELMDAEKQAEEGDAEKQYYVAGLYYEGEKVMKDRVKALDLYKKAATQGHVQSQTELAFMYLDGEVVRQDLGEYIKWLKKAAAQKYSHAENMLGISYENGTGVRKDYAIAKEWFGKSCDGGDKRGCYEYKRLNEKGY